jgi:hypothetical protein
MSMTPSRAANRFKTVSLLTAKIARTSDAMRYFGWGWSDVDREEEG